MKRHVFKGMLSVMLVLTGYLTKAQTEIEMADGMRSEGKIYVVVAIILIILSGLIGYLALLDRKIRKLEDLVKDQEGGNKS